MLGILNCKIGFKMPFQGYQIFRNPGKQGKSYKKWFNSNLKRHNQRVAHCLKITQNVAF